MMTLTLVCLLSFGSWTPPEGWTVAAVEPGHMASAIILTPTLPHRADWTRSDNGTPTRVTIQRRQKVGEPLFVPPTCHVETVTTQ